MDDFTAHGYPDRPEGKRLPARQREAGQWPSLSTSLDGSTVSARKSYDYYTQSIIFDWICATSHNFRTFVIDTIDLAPNLQLLWVPHARTRAYPRSYYPVRL